MTCPTGTTVLEASAGTGKTFAIGALVTRYVAEGVRPLDEMLVITFGRAASQELRERVREQLVEAERALADPGRTAREPGVDSSTAPTSTTPSSPYAGSGSRDALADFDAATIATTHQFCQSVLRSLGVAGDTDAGAELVENLDDLVVEVVDDLYLRRFGTSPTTRRSTGQSPSSSPAPPSATRRRRWPRDADPGSAAGSARVRRDVRAEMDRRKRRLGILSYDDLLSRLADALEERRLPGAASGCGSGGGSCWSTSSRTPTRCSGGCSTAPSPATPRWC